ncbi:hypothetical protein QE152_g38015 [Popillia japonica]|uniref:Leucine-rich melanocyte differentiation-associated protein n=1 Tax=Popillia japonica TaxID=7064 RepID=A0AAW1I823_POPJA
MYCGGVKRQTIYIRHKYTIHIKTESEAEEKQSLLSYNMEHDIIEGNRESKLCYSGQRCHRIPDALIKLYGPKLYGPKVSALDLSYNELVTLRGLEGFPNLQELILDNNQLGDAISFPRLPQLHTLSLNKNRIEDVEILLKKISRNLPSVTYLSLLGNKACPNELSDLQNDDEDYQRYRYYVLYHLPKLKFLDSRKVGESERTEAKSRGQLMKIVRPKPGINSEEYIIAPLPSPYGPLPRVMRNPHDHKGVYAKCKYRYSGKHSEGNRFISNNDL